MKPELKRKEDFKKALANFKVSEKGKELIANLKLVMLTSPSSVGRNTLINRLVDTGRYAFIVSDTTRPKRVNDGVPEQDGVEYWFRSEDEILADVEAGLYLEAELIHNQQVSGVSVRELERIANLDKIAISEVDFGGIDSIHNAKPDTYAILVLPPSYEEWMNRLKNRGNMTTDEIQNRLITAEKILESAQTRDYYKILINDDLDEAVGKLRGIIEHDDYSSTDHEQGLKVAWEVLGRVKQQLNS